MYILFSGCQPFDAEDDDECLKLVVRGNYVLVPEIWGQISKDAKDLLGALLSYNPTGRLSAGQAMEHTWVKNLAPAARDRKLSADAWKNMRAWRGQGHLKKAAMQIIAKRLSATALKHLKQIFIALDTNCDGSITYEELKV